MKNLISTGVAFFLILTLSAHPTQAATINIPADFATIQEGIDVAVDGDLVLVAPGVYLENIYFSGKAITLRSEGHPGETIIDGNQNDSVVRFGSEETEATHLDGFTIRNGYAQRGGGIYCYHSSPTITDCIIKENSAVVSNPSFGGGMYCENSTPTIMNCSILYNNADDGGGGIYCRASSPPITNCLFKGNSTWEGGGIKLYGSSPPITNCVFLNNDGGHGGAIRCDRGCSSIITNCTFVGNGRPGGEGGAIFCYEASPTITNSILWENLGDLGPELRLRYYSTPTVSYSNVKGGEAAVYIGEHDCVPHWLGGNIDADPMFMGDDDFRLDVGSPGIDAGDPDPLQNDICFPPSLGTERNDMGAYGGPSACAWCGDHDGDGHDAAVCGGTDCDDMDPQFHPGALELCDQRDNDCDGLIPDGEFLDEDGDGWVLCADCMDSDPTVRPDSVEGLGLGNCEDDIDNDCDGLVDTDPACEIVINIPGDYPTIQQGIQNAIDGVLVTVDPGIYEEHVVIDKVVNLQSVYGADSTIIDGHIGLGSVVVFETDSIVDAVLEGFTIRNGIGKLHFGYPMDFREGGGIYISSTSSPTIRNCTITGNSASYGGGILSWGPSPTITNCTISNNSVAGMAGGAGGGIKCSGSPTISNCIIAENRAFGDVGHAKGGGIWTDGFPVITNCTISGNTVGGVITDGSGLYEQGGDATITNCILWWNSPFAVSQIRGTPVVTYSDVQGGWSGEGNIDADPLLLGGGDFHLNPGSPCIDTGTDAEIYIDMDGDVRPFGAGFDMGTDEYTGEYWAFVLDTSYGEGVLSLQFTLGLLEPATWVNYLILTTPSVQVIPLWSISLPVILPHVEVPISFPLPSLGWVGIYSGLFTAEGPLTFKLEWVNTES